MMPAASMVLPEGVAAGVRLIASDLDGTLLAPDKTVTPRTQAALRAAHEAGIVVVVATGRQLATLPPDVARTPADYLVVSNGALVFRASTEEIVLTELIPPAALAAVVGYLGEHVPGALVGVARGDGTDFVSEPGYLDQMSGDEMNHDRRRHRVAPRAEIVGEPALKLAVRHPDICADDLLVAIEASGLPGFVATTSGAPFVEIGAAGVDKATALAHLCALLGVDPAAVVAFGDAKNDIPMLRWAGCGVAMGDAVPEAVAAADARTADCADDGLAQMVERIVAARRPHR